MKKKLTGYVFPIVLVAVAAFLVLSVGGGSAPMPAAFAEALTIDQATARSADSGKPVLVFATADWCGPCQRLKRGALADERVSKAILERTEPVYLDLTNPEDDKEAAEAAQQMGVRGIPALLLVRDGQVISRQGPGSVGQLLTWLEAH